MYYFITVSFFYLFREVHKSHTTLRKTADVLDSDGQDLIKAHDIKTYPEVAKAKVAVRKYEALKQEVQDVVAGKSTKQKYPTHTQNRQGNSYHHYKRPYNNYKQANNGYYNKNK